MRVKIRFPLRLVFIFSLMFGLMFGFGACSSTPSVTRSNLPLKDSDREIEMSGIVIQSHGQAFDAEELFDRGVKALEEQKFIQCEEDFNQYFKHFPQHEYRHFAHYNWGLCLEFQRKYQLAAQVFETYAQESKDPKERLDGDVRRGYNLVFSAQYPLAIELYTRLLTTANLTGLARGECLLRRSMAYTALEKFSLADHDLGTALSYIRPALSVQQKHHPLLAETHFQRGEVYRHYMNKVKLELPVAAIKRSIADKVRFFEKSRYAFISSIETQNTYWAIASGHQLGLLYEDLYEVLSTVDAPPEFDEELRAYYYFEIDEMTVKLLENSVSIYEKAVTISARHQVDNVWVKSLTKMTKRLHKLVFDVQARLRMEPLEAYQARKKSPFIRTKLDVPLPPPAISVKGQAAE